MNLSERRFRDEWADYFRERAAKSRSNAAKLPPDKRDHWLGVAGGEEACAMTIGGTEPVEDLVRALSEGTSRTAG